MSNAHSTSSMLTRLGAAAALALAGSACPSDVITNYNTSPTASINYPTEGALLTGSVDFQGRVSDNQQSPDTLSVQWTSNVDGVLDATPSDADGVAVFTSASLTYGSQVVTLTAVDDKASSGTATVTFTLVPPQPEVQILDPASGASFTVGDEITFRGTVSSAEGEVSLPVRWSSSIDGTLWEGVSDSGGVTLFTADDLTEGVHVVTLIATDEGEGWSVDGQAQVTFEVESLPKGQLDQDGDGFTPDEGDCDDFDADTYPGAAESCDGEDNDCNGVIDDGFDADGDGYSWCASDCDDADISIHPGAFEACDGIDQDCDGVIDDGFDVDGDGYTTCEGDCDDTQSTVRPGALEICDTLDNDCDGSFDEGFDADGDGFSACGSDCNDANADVHPGVPEVCDSIDNDCSGIADDGFDIDGDGYASCAGDCDDTHVSVYPGAIESCDNRDNDCDGVADENFDADFDGFTTCGGDCNDGNAAIYPGRSEVCDGLDQDCDGVNDDGFDVDGDGYSTCEGDCDDTVAATRPGAAEVCDGFDNDCDGSADEGFDADHDGFSSCAGDCDDSNINVNPGKAEICDTLDQDCDGEINNGFEGTSEPDNEDNWETDWLNLGDLEGNLSFFFSCGGVADTCLSYAPAFLYYCYEEQVASGRFHSTTDSFDAYRFYYEPVVDLFDYGLTPCGVDIVVSNIPSGANYAAKLYYRQDAGDAWDLVDSSDNSGSAQETLSYGSGGWDFDGEYVLVVESKGNWACSGGSIDYNVSIRGA